MGDPLSGQAPSGRGHWLALSWRGLRRDLRAADVRALFVALALAVAASTMIGFFLDRLERGLERQAGQMLGGDLVLEQSRPFDNEIRQRLRDAGLALSEQVDMVSMASFDGAFEPASVKVVDDAYPHYGEVHVERQGELERVATGPAPGEVWIAPRLAQLLDIEEGDSLQLGATSLDVTGLIEREPDQQGGFGSFNPRLMMHMDDLEATELVQEGSRVEFELLGRGPSEVVASLQDWLDTLAAEGVEVQDVRRDRPQLGNALSRAEQYLSLAGLAAVLLAGVAVAMATRRYVDRHLDTAALLRCFGATQRQLTRLFALQLLWLALAASAVGAILGLVGQAGLLMLLSNFLPLELPPPGPMPLLLGILTAMAILAGFAGPTLLRLKRVSALKVLRREFDPLPASAWAVIGVASLVFGGLLWLYSGNLTLSLAILAGGMVMLAVLWGLGALLMTGVLHLASRVPATVSGNALVVRLGARQLARRRRASLGQLLAFSVTFSAMAMIALVRGDLLTTWQSQLPDDTPNFFAINIQPNERESFSSMLEGAADSRSALYPMVRGRISEINGNDPRAAVPDEARGDNALRRELNLTWRSDVPEGNRIVAGEWFGEGGQGNWLGAVDAHAAGDAVPISMEDGLADRFGLRVGDTLTFAIGSAEITGEITSLRDLDWDSFRPNFYVIFPPDVLERFGHSYITAFHLDSEERALQRELAEAFPGVSLINVDAILERVRELLSQVTHAVELVLLLVLLAGISVLYAALIASRPVRAHESGLLRVFGAGDRLISRIQGAEFALLGLISGVMGALLAELAAAGLYLGWLDLSPRMHWELWVVLPFGGALLIGMIGHVLSRSVRRQTPMASLGLLGEA
ncbi:ABC transporter permease [Aidingimonas halophila]|nr:FtsX-like permease family protein [Aidingimonas halophila]